MAGSNDYGRKGSCVGRGALFLALIIIMFMKINTYTQSFSTC